MTIDCEETSTTRGHMRSVGEAGGGGLSHNNDEKQGAKKKREDQKKNLQKVLYKPTTPRARGVEWYGEVS